jgi:hypothetical protein
MKSIILSVSVVFLSLSANALELEEPDRACVNRSHPPTLACAEAFPATTISEIFKNQINGFQSYSVKPLDSEGTSHQSSFVTQDIGVHLTWSKKERGGIVARAAGALLKDFLTIDADDLNIRMIQKKGDCTYPYILSKKEKGPITCDVSAATRRDPKCSNQIRNDPLITKVGVCNQFISSMLQCSKDKNRAKCSDTLFASVNKLDSENSSVPAAPASRETPRGTSGAQ